MSHRDLGVDDVFKNEADDGQWAFSQAKRIPFDAPWKDSIIASDPSFGDGLTPSTDLTEKMLKYLGEVLNNNSVSVEDGKGFLNKPEGDHPGIPAGYTYLYQLASHDIVHTSLEPRSFDDYAVKSSNMRREKLALETIFGGGPIGCPHAYDMQAEGGAFTLRLGKFCKVGGNRNTRVDPAGDLPRTRYDVDKALPCRSSFTDVLIADPRNDDNNILAQLTVIFHQLYNRLVEQSRDVVPPGSAGPIPAHHRSRLARLATIRIYRRILRYDLLARIMHPDIWARFDKEAAQLLLGSDPDVATDLFAFGASRVAHSMVRPVYTLNPKNTDGNIGELSLRKIINTSSQHFPGMTPPSVDWKIDWSLFFTADPQGDVPEDFNWAIRFGPHTSDTMALPNAGKPTKDGYPSGTAMRDLIREKWANMGKVSDIARSVREKLGMLQVNAPFATADYPTEVGKAGIDFLEASVMDGHKPDLGSDELEAIKANPPLMVFLMCEAQREGNNGQTYGPLGSIIVGEAFANAFKDVDPTDSQEIIAALLETETFGETPIKSMPQLIAALGQI